MSGLNCPSMNFVGSVLLALVYVARAMAQNATPTSGQEPPSARTVATVVMGALVFESLAVGSAPTPDSPLIDGRSLRP